MRHTGSRGPLISGGLWSGVLQRLLASGMRWGLLVQELLGALGRFDALDAVEAQLRGGPRAGVDAEPVRRPQQPVDQRACPSSQPQARQ